MDIKVFNDALPEIKSALIKQLKDSGLPLDAASLHKHLTETWKASDKHAKAIITSLKRNDPDLLKTTVEAAAKEEAASGTPGFFSKLWSKMSGPKTVATVATTAAVGSMAHDSFEGDDASKTDSKEPKKASFDEKTGASTVPVTKTSAPKSEPVREGPATKEEIAAHLQRLQAQHPGLNVKTSIMDYMKARGLSGSFAERAKIAAENGIHGYRGTAAQNIDLARRIREKYGKSEGDLPETIVL